MKALRTMVSELEMVFRNGVREKQDHSVTKYIGGCLIIL